MDPVPLFGRYSYSHWVLGARPGGIESYRPLPQLGILPCDHGNLRGSSWLLRFVTPMVTPWTPTSRDFLLDDKRWRHSWLVMYSAQTMVRAQTYMYISRPKYTRQSLDCPLVIFSFTALPSCLTALHRTALPLPSIALSLILLILLAAHACTLIASILQEYRLQTPCPCYKCDHCLHKQWVTTAIGSGRSSINLESTIRYLFSPKRI